MSRCIPGCRLDQHLGVRQWVLENCFPCGTIDEPNLKDIKYVKEMPFGEKALKKGCRFFVGAKKLETCKMVFFLESPVMRPYEGVM